MKCARRKQSSFNALCVHVEDGNFISTLFHSLLCFLFYEGKHTHTTDTKTLINTFRNRLKFSLSLSLQYINHLTDRLFVFFLFLYLVQFWFSIVNIVDSFILLLYQQSQMFKWSLQFVVLLKLQRRKRDQEFKRTQIILEKIETVFSVNLLTTDKWKAFAIFIHSNIRNAEGAFFIFGVLFIQRVLMLNFL